jgi:hypothetical protein
MVFSPVAQILDGVGGMDIFWMMGGIIGILVAGLGFGAIVVWVVLR